MCWRKSGEVVVCVPQRVDLLCSALTFNSGFAHVFRVEWRLIEDETRFECPTPRRKARGVGLITNHESRIAGEIEALACAACRVPHNRGECYTFANFTRQLAIHDPRNLESESRVFCLPHVDSSSHKQLQDRTGVRFSHTRLVSLHAPHGGGFDAVLVLSARSSGGHEYLVMLDQVEAARFARLFSVRG